jgi:hypothetical protein
MKKLPGLGDILEIGRELAHVEQLLCGLTFEISQTVSIHPVPYQPCMLKFDF